MALETVKKREKAEAEKNGLRRRDKILQRCKPKGFGFRTRREKRSGGGMKNNPGRKEVKKLIGGGRNRKSKKKEEMGVGSNRCTVLRGMEQRRKSGLDQKRSKNGTRIQGVGVLQVSEVEAIYCTVWWDSKS